MNMSISLTADSQLKLSASRIAQLMNSDIQKATKLSVFDRVLDFFRPQSRETALKELHHLLHDGGTSNFARFDLLSQLATPESKSLFTLDVSDRPNDEGVYTVNYAINGDVIKSDAISAQTRDLIMDKLGVPLNTAVVRQQMTTIDSYRQVHMQTPQELAKVQDEAFAGGGVNKSYLKENGLLCARNKTGKDDFERERGLAEYAAQPGRAELASYISTQKKIDAPSQLNQKFAYALVDVYDPDKIASHEMDDCLAALSRDQARSLLTQLVDMARVLYKNQVAHRDLHMHNLMVHQVKETGSVHLKAIDFGRLAMDKDFEAKKFEDIDYLFAKQGANLLETIGRNHLAPAGSDIDRKHYPIHKLCQKFNEKDIQLDPVLARIGAHLKEDLKHAGEDSALVDAAFEKASQTLQLGFVQLQLNPPGVKYA